MWYNMHLDLGYVFKSGDQAMPTGKKEPAAKKKKLTAKDLKKMTGGKKKGGPSAKIKIRKLKKPSSKAEDCTPCGCEMVCDGGGESCV